MDKIAFFMEIHCCHTGHKQPLKTKMVALSNDKPLFFNGYFQRAGLSQQRAM